MSKMTPSKIVENALGLAIRYHAGQSRKNGMPYIIHPMMVVAILIKNEFSDDIVAAGACHDLLEDTSCTREEIVSACGEDVLEIVLGVTDEPQYSSLEKWEERKHLQIERAREASDKVKAVFIADKIHNLQTLLNDYSRQGPSMWKGLNRGKTTKVKFEQLCLEMLRETWNHPLINFYEELIKEEEKLEG